MAIHIDTFNCSICGHGFEVLHSGKPTIRDFNNSELLKDCDGKNIHVCFTCETNRDDNDD